MTAILNNRQGADLKTYELRATVIRYVRAGDARDAASHGSLGLRLSNGVVEYIVARPAAAEPYRHAGEDNLWRVTVDIDAAVYAADAEDATETAHRMVSVERGNHDTFEHELAVQAPQLR